MKTTSRQADATLAQLTRVMARNTSLATSTPPVPAGPVATYTKPAASAPPRKPLIATQARAAGSSGIRLKADDHARIRQVILAGLELQHTLTASDAIRLALHAYDPKQLTADDIARLRASDGRSHAGRGMASS